MGRPLAAIAVLGEAGIESCGDWSNEVERGSSGHSSRVDEAWTTECPHFGTTFFGIASGITGTAFS